MFSKTANTPTPTTTPTTTPTSTPTTPSAPTPARMDAPSPASDPAAQRKPKVATLVAEHMTIEGGISGDGELHVDGIVRGDLRIGKLTIGETGHVEGTIVADSVENRGRIVGAVTAKQVRLYASAYVDGDVTHEQLAMEIGAFFQGRSLKFQRPAGAQPAAIAAPQPAAESRAKPSESPAVEKPAAARDDGSAKVVN